MIYFDLSRFLGECGGNPQLLKFQIKAMEDVGLSLLGDKGENVLVLPTPEDIGWRKSNLSKDYINLKKCVGWTGQGFKHFLENPSSDKVTLARNKTWIRATTSHILGFESLEIDSMIPLREMIFGYTISGNIVNRDTFLYDKWRVYDAESKGLLYLKEIEKESFQITFPFLYLYKSSWKGEGTGLFPVTALDKDHLNFRDIEYVDIEMIAFNIWWYFKKNPKSDTFTLHDVFPNLNFKFGNLPFKKPKEITLAATKRKFDGNWDKLVEENWTFGITTPTDTTVDSFAILHSNTNEIWKLLIQSKLRKSGSGDHDFSDKDLTQQLGYLKQMGITDNNWIRLSEPILTLKQPFLKNMLIISCQSIIKY